MFALGAPYITASIVTTAHHSDSQLGRNGKEGEEGRKKLAQYTRYATVVLALIQALSMVAWMRSAVIRPSFTTYAVIVLALSAGTAFLMWLGEEITDKGIGNGVSLIIFAGIVSRLPTGLVQVASYLKVGAIGIINVVLLGLAALGIVVAVIYVQEGERRITVQYAKRVVGRRFTAVKVHTYRLR